MMFQRSNERRFWLLRVHSHQLTGLRWTQYSPRASRSLPNLGIWTIQLDVTHSHDFSPPGCDGGRVPGNHPDAVGHPPLPPLQAQALPPLPLPSNTWQACQAEQPRGGHWKGFHFSLFKISLSTVCWKGGRQDVGVRRGWLGGGRGQHWPLFPQVLTRVWVLKIPPPILPPSQALPLCSRVPAEAGPDQFGLRAVRLLCAGLSSGTGPTPLSSIR